MLSPSIAFRKYLLGDRTQYLKVIPFVLHLRSQRTEARPLGRQETFDGVRAFKEIPKPNGWKLMYDIITKTERFTKQFKINERLFTELGPIYREDITFKPFEMVHVIDPEDFEKVFRAEGKYPQRVIIEVWAEHRKRRNHFLGLVQLNGKEWHRARQTIAPKIMRPKIVEENIVNFNAVSNNAVVRFVKLKDACGQDDHIPDLQNELNKWSLEGIGTVAFDTRLGLYEDPPSQEALKFTKAVATFFQQSQQLLNVFNRSALQYFDTPLFKRFLANTDFIREIAQRFIDQKMRELLEMTGKGIDSDNAQVVPLLTYLIMKEDITPMELNGQVIDVVFSAVDTTSTSCLWLLYNLARFPSVQEKLYQEIESVLGEDGDVTPRHLANLRYLKACLKESMRLTPSISALPRLLDEDVVLSGYHVPAQTMVLMDFYATTRSENYFKDPLKFKPERWLRENKDAHSFSHLQFGFGPRSCVGRRLAELEMYVLMCKLLRRFRFEYNHEPLDLCQKILLVPDKPVKIKFVDRI